MSRLPAVSNRDAGLSTKIAFYFMKRHFTRLTGRQNETMLGPVRIMAHIPKLLSGYGKLEQAAAKVHLLDLRHRALAELKAATTIRCEYCIDLGSRISRRTSAVRRHFRACARVFVLVGVLRDAGTVK